MFVLDASSILFATLFALVSTQAINPESVPESTRATWCTTQKSSCPLLCPQIGGTTTPDSNDCDPATLNFSCVCSNGLQPNASEYSQTIPYFLCTETANQCAANCGDNSNCVTQCRTAKPCGAQDPKRVNVSSSITASATGSSTAASASQTNSYNGFGGPDSANSAASSSASAARNFRVTGASAERGEILCLFAIAGAFLTGFHLIS